VIADPLAMRVSEEMGKTTVAGTMGSIGGARCRPTCRAVCNKNWRTSSRWGLTAHASWSGPWVPMTGRSTALRIRVGRMVSVGTDTGLGVRVGPDIWLGIRGPVAAWSAGSEMRLAETTLRLPANATITSSIAWAVRGGSCGCGARSMERTFLEKAALASEPSLVQQAEVCCEIGVWPTHPLLISSTGGGSQSHEQVIGTNRLERLAISFPACCVMLSPCVALAAEPPERVRLRSRQRIGGP
jgi:hypothetical protein